MKIKFGKIRKILAILIIGVFLANTTAISQEVFLDDITPPLISQENPPTDGSAAFRDGVMSDMKFMSVAFSIADQVFDSGGNIEALRDALLSKFQYAEEFLEEQYIDLSSIYSDDYRKDGVIRLDFTAKDGSGKGIIGICHREQGEVFRLSDKRWEILGKYAFFVEKHPMKASTEDRDLKGPEASEANPLITEHIKNSRVAELYISGKDESLKAARVRYLKSYVPGDTSFKTYLGQDVDVFQLFTKAERKNLEEWMREHSIRGSPVKFRVILGGSAIGWESDTEHSNIAHAGIRDSVIYVGSLLLKHIMKDGNDDIRKAILDEDEFQHLKGLDHGTDEDLSQRLELVKNFTTVTQMREIEEALLKNDVYFLLGELRERLKEEDHDRLFEMLSMVNNVAMGQPLYPVERTYPIKHAASLLEKEEQDRLVDILTSSTSRALGYRYQVVVDELLLMLDESRKLEEWVKVYAPNLEGRSLWQISPEIWHEAGGLARVMQYHGAGIKQLIGSANVRLRHVEPHYQNRIDAKGKSQPLDYTSKEQITHPIQGEIKEVARFTVTVGGKEVNAIASRGVNDLGIEVYLIMDEEGFYTHSLYNYRNVWETKKQLPTWEEFSVFYSKASLELVKIIEGKEKKAMEELNREWKAPVLHLNDSQVALVSTYRKIFFDKDEVLGEAVVAFTTHTYGNRKEYPLNEGYGDNVLNFMEIPLEFRELFKHYQRGGDVYDIASGGLRTADWQGAVARAHRDDVFIYDDWVNYSDDPNLAAYYRDKGVEYSLVAVSNGDHRANTMVYFTEKMQRLYGEDVNVEHPTAEQIEEVKKLAKLELKVSDDKKYYSSHKNESWEKAMLSPDQMVVSYSGRLVPEKAGRSRAFTDQNIENMVKRGIQVVIYGNVQSNNTTSDALRDGLIALIEKLKAKKYPGRLIFVPRFSLNDQRALLAASDVQVQDSHPSTEAAGFTESDISACGGIEVGTRRDDNEVGEGLFEAQGVPMNLDVPGEGNVLIPERLDAKSYLDAIISLQNKYNNGELKHYQATSVRLSRILEARLTSAAYLREFSKAIGYKERKKSRGSIEVTSEKKKIRTSRDGDDSLIAQLYRDDPKVYTVHKISEMLKNGDVEGAVVYFFTSEAFQGIEGNLSAPMEAINMLLDAVADRSINDGLVKVFLKNIISGISEFSSNKDVSQSLQLMAGQALTIISWMERGIPASDKVRLTLDEEKMVASEKRGKSFIDKTTLSIPEVKSEGASGFYFRGTEKITTKLDGDNTNERLIFSPERSEQARENIILYLMDHGFIKVPESISALTDSGILSTMHETFFLTDRTPGSFQATSTGAGHFQGTKLDVKHVTEGKGIQLNVRYNAEGEIEEVMAQQIGEGDWAFALPGCVDYMINLGGLRFNDFSIDLGGEEASRFNPEFDFSQGNLKKVTETVSLKAKTAPYLIANLDGYMYLVKNIESAPSVQWRPAHIEASARLNLIDVYKGLDENGIEALKENLLGAQQIVAVSSSRIPDIKPLEDSDVTSAETLLGPGLSCIEGIRTYVDKTASLLARTFGEEAKEDVLVRVSLDTIEAIGSSSLKDYINEIQKTSHGYIQLIEPDTAKEVSLDVYKKYDIERKALPEGFKGSRKNTVTLLPVLKGQELSAKALSSGEASMIDVGGLEDSIISPLGMNFDKSGFIRSMSLGLGLVEVARGNTDIAQDILAQYREFAETQGISNFDLNTDDIISLATGNINQVVFALNKLIKSLPIMPLNAEELREIYEHARKALISA